MAICNAVRENGTGTPHICGRKKGHKGKHSCRLCETAPGIYHPGKVYPAKVRFRWIGKKRVHK
jgi:hypothetical protein